jgi:hypothetical protein
MEELAAQAKADVQTVVRKATFDLFRAVVMRSPVGNPDLWRSNSGAAYRRGTFNVFAERLNQLGEGGRVRPRSDRSLRKMFPNPVGRGYVGGRFRANWNVSQGTPDTSTTESTQKGRGLAEAARALELAAGGVVYLSNGLPYARRLEYEGWSTQAPMGMVRLSVAEFDDFVREATKR